MVKIPPSTTHGTTNHQFSTMAMPARNAISTVAIWSARATLCFDINIP
jgi:hypothetical protein